ncbi:MAG: NADPH-dependent F420 reductase [Alphaproteobacteria bacterium]|nr:NADPH-dependent F420 reductase [Alphaproteobacteria bacterium]
MKIAVIGAGNVGRALAGRFARAGHEVAFGVRNPSDAKHAALEASRKTPREAAAAAEIVVLCTPWPATEAACRDLGSIAGNIVIDCTNPLAMGAQGLGLAVGHTSSGGEMVASWCPGASVFKSFNTTGFGIMAAPDRMAHKPVMFVAGDDAPRKPTVLELVAACGFEAVDAGPLSNSRLLEPFAMLWIDQAMKRGAGRDFAFAITRPSR